MVRIEIKSEITGTVWKLQAKPGDTLIVIESMTIEIPVIAEDGGILDELLVSERDSVDEGQIVAIIKA